MKNNTESTSETNLTNKLKRSDRIRYCSFLNSTTITTTTTKNGSTGLFQVVCFFGLVLMWLVLLLMWLLFIYFICSL